MADLNKSIPTLRTVDNEAIERALEGVDPQMPATFVPNPSLRPMQRFKNVSDVANKDAYCRSFTTPSPSLRTDPAARIGCGWWYVPDTPYARGSSVGAYGTRRGPINTAIDKEYGSGMWIWDVDEARKQEELKRSRRVTTCNGLRMPSPDVQLGWCSETGGAIVLNTGGNVAYPDDQNCSSGSIIRNPAYCPVQTAAGTPVPAWECNTQPLSTACVQALVTNAGCSAQGTLYDSLNSGRPTQSQVFNSVYQYITDGGFSLNNGILTDGNVSLDMAHTSLKGLKGVADTSTTQLPDNGKLIIQAAKKLCYGTEFTPCNILDSKTQPYDLECIRKLGMSMGYSRTGILLSNGASYWNRFATWKDVKDHLAYFKQYADTGPVMSKQVDAIKNVYGVSVKSTVPGCIINSIPTLALWFDAADPHGNGANPADNEVISTWVNKAGNQQYNAKAVKTDARFNAQGGGTYSNSRKGLRLNKNLYETNYPANPATETVFIVCNTNTPTNTRYNSALISGRQGARGIWAGYTDAGGSNRGSSAPGTMGVLSSDVRWLGSTAVGTYKHGKTTISTVQIDSRQPITDAGYGNRPRGWYDAKGDGRGALDYGRWVGDGPIWWSVALADESSQYSEASASKSRFSQPNPATLSQTAPSNPSPPFPKFSVSLNGSAPNVGAITAPFVAGTTTMIGQQLGAGYIAYNFDGYVMEIVIYKSVLPQEQIQKVEGYLAWKWGLSKELPNYHPYKLRAP